MDCNLGRRSLVTASKRRSRQSYVGRPHVPKSVKGLFRILIAERDETFCTNKGSDVTSSVLKSLQEIIPILHSD